MFPTKAFVSAIAAKIGADTSWLAEATTFVLVTLIKAAFTPSPNLLVGSLTPADFTGSDPKHANSAATQVFRDPATGDWILRVQEPAGGWQWTATAAPTPAQTVYGYILTSADGTKLIGSALLENPVVIGGVGDGVELSGVEFRLPLGSIV